ncbi:UNVERIFIED_CONTAM: hypothetical protein FKN15_030173 [Acipenser sinensis]
MVDPCSFRYDEDSPPMALFCPLEREESCVTDDDMLKLELMTCDDSEDECSSSINHTVIKIAEAAIENRSPLPEVLPEVVSFKDSSNIEGNVEEGKVFSNPSTVEVNERACNFINGTHEESDLFHGLELQEKKILNINTNATVIESSVKLLSKSEGLKREQANFFEQQKEVKEKGIEADLSPLDGDIEECGSWAMDLTELFKGSSNEECNKKEAHQKNSVKTCQKSNTVEEKLLFETVDKTSDSYIVHQKKDLMLKLELMTCDDSEGECSSSINHTVIKIAEAAIENRSPLPEVLPEVVSFKDSSNIEGNVEEGKVFSNPSTVEVNERACNFINGTHEESDLFHGLELQEKKILNINTNATVIESSVKLLSKSEGLKREQANFFEQQKEVKEKGIEADLSPLDGDIEECGSWAMDLTELFKGSSNEECNKQEAHQKNSVKTCQKSNTVEEKLLFETVDKTSDSYIVHQKKDLVFDEKKDWLVLLLLEPIPTNFIQDRFCKLRKLMNKNTFLEWPHDEA